MDMSAMSLDTEGSWRSGWQLPVTIPCRGGRNIGQVAIPVARVADCQTWPVPQDLAHPPVAVATAFVASDGEPAAYATAAAALAAAEVLRRAQPDAVIAVHVADRAGSGAARARRLHEIGRPGQTLVSSAAAAALPAGAPLHDLGIHRLRDLSLPERVFALGAPGDEPLRSLDATPNNLPSRPTTFVGRATELADLHGRLARARLVTITGPGGSGKSRLAAQLAADEAARRPDGAWWVELGDVADPGEVAQTVAAALGVLVDPAEGTVTLLRAQLASRRLLLCLDNCEHLLDATAEVAGALFAGCPEVAIVATSREPLGLTGELVWRLPPLPAAEAHALFVERAAHVQPGLALDADAGAAIDSMCARLDGSPLALELAAAWLRTLTPRQIEAGLDDRFALLVRSPRDAVPRHASLLASMAWSHNLLDGGDRAVFRRLAVFPGSFDLDAGRAVCGEEPDALGALARLVDKSLVVADGARYRLPETIREYAADRLRAAGERRATTDRLLAHLLARVRDAAPLRDTDKDAWRAALAPEHDNLRAAIEHGLLADDPEPARALVAELPWLWQMHRQGREGLDFLRRAIARNPVDRSAVQARLLTGVALVADTAGPLDLEYDAAQRACELAAELGDERLLSLCLALAAVGRLYTDFDDASELALEAERIATRAGDEFVINAQRALRGIVAHLRDEHDGAQTLLGDAAERLEARGDRGVAASALAFLSGSALLTGELGRAREIAERSVATAAPLADHLRIGMGRAALGLALGAAGDVEGGVAALAPVRALADDVFLPDVNRALGLLHLWAGEPDAAVARLAVEARSTDGGRPTYLAARALPALAAAQRHAGAAEDAAGTAERGAALARERGMPGVLADCLDEQGHLDDDADRHHEALAIRVRHGLRPGILRSLEALAAYAPEEQAARLNDATAAARARLGLASGATDPPGDAGAVMSLAEAAAYASRARGSRRRPDHGWASLTPAELEVVRLAVDGLSNPEIGARLYMSRSTVKTHLSHVYTKLGVANRTELAAQAPDEEKRRAACDR
jgi:predicted ATPase/DNA-binding CsgD family transcriptional regulator